jgi:AraC-like DNA-binding protein
MGWAGECAFTFAGVVFRGETADNRPHRHAAVQVTLGLHGPVTILEFSGGVSERPVSGPALVVRPDVVHALQPGGQVLLALLPPQTRLAQRILRDTTPGGVAILSAGLTASIDAGGCLVTSLDGLRTPPSDIPTPDERVLRALAFLESARGPRAIERAAACAGLSISRLRAIASAHLEVPLSRWSALRQLQRAGHALVRGASLAEAAIDAGFADQAHLTRQMRRTFGVTPATVAALVRGADRRFVQDGA